VRAKLLIPILALGIAVAGTACLPPSGGGPPATPDGVVAAVNQDRAANGLSALAGDPQLTAMAQSWAEHMAATGALAHQDLGSIIGSPLMGSWRGLSENVFGGPPSASDATVENMWMGSALHQANILDPGMNHIGVGVAHDASGRTWVVADFGAR
jgi:uncharacterized protein YkwD